MNMDKLIQKNIIYAQIMTNDFKLDSFKRGINNRKSNI